jgi:basic amino acid/polyamine antiporter, APA family
MALFDNLFRKKSIADAIETAAHESDGSGLEKNLSVRDLTAFGIAAIIGAGIFSTIGTASFNGGPGVVFLFIFTALACGFAAFAYAEFASLLPVSGSAYTYSYVAFGELVAWIIGWALVMEYAVGNITVAVSWSSYFTSLCASAGWDIPAWASIDYATAKGVYADVTKALQSGGAMTDSQREGYHAWEQAPLVGGIRMILDIPAIIMSILITGLVYVGIKETKVAGNILVVLKMLVVLAVIVVGAFYVDTSNWHPFLPNGFGGVMAGVSSVFFAYIGFDALSTTAEECKNPQRDLPRAMVYSIVICTILYIIIALVLTGMVSYQDLKVADPLAFVFDKVGLKWFSGIVAVSAVVAMAGVFLVFQLGQPRIWMVMSRDGLLPKRFSHIHPKFRTPTFATVVTGFFVVVPMLFISSDTVLDLCSMGTLFAFVLVCAGVLKLQLTPDAPRGAFRTPYINGKFLFPALIVAMAAFLFSQYPKEVNAWVTNERQMYAADDFVSKLDAADVAKMNEVFARSDSAAFAAQGGLGAYLSSLSEEQYATAVSQANVTDNKKYESGWQLFQHKIPMWLFVLLCVALSWLCLRYSLSLIPVLGLICCFYMMAQIPAKSWFGFFTWLVVGLFLYFGYGYANSNLSRKNS